MKTVIEMAIEVGISDLTIGLYQQELERFAELVRADERNSLAAKLVQDCAPAFGKDTCASWAVWIKNGGKA